MQVKRPPFMKGKTQRGSWVWDREKQKLVPKAEYHASTQNGGSIQVLRDIDPYKSAVTGEVIGGRRQHRDHLRAHGLVEVGNEKLTHRKAPPAAVAPDIRQALDMVRSGYRPGPLGTFRDE